MWLTLSVAAVVLGRWLEPEGQTCLDVSLHAVRTPGGDLLTVYRDPILTGYLTHLAGAEVTPLYSAEPLCFVREGRILISTARLLDFDGEDALRKELAARRGRLPARSSAGCHRDPGFVPLWRRLRFQITQYEEWARRRLKRRSSALALR